MTGTLHLLALLTALFVGGQAVASKSVAELRCRFTGKVMRGCPCPEKKRDAGTELAKASCCELREADEVPRAAALPASTGAPFTVVLHPPASPVLRASTTVDVLRPRVPGTAPPAKRQRLFVELRHLLI